MSRKQLGTAASAANDAATLGDVWPGRTTAAYTTASLADGATETGAITLAKGYRLVKLQLSAAARVRMYGTTAERTADAARAWGTDPGQGVGLLLDYLAAASGTWDLSPTVDGFSTESTPVVTIPIAVTNQSGSTHTVALTLTYLRTE